MKNRNTLKHVLPAFVLIALLVLSTTLNLLRLQSQNIPYGNNEFVTDVRNTNNTANALALIIAIGSTLGIAGYGIYEVEVKGDEIINL